MSKQPPSRWPGEEHPADTGSAGYPPQPYAGSPGFYPPPAPRPPRRRWPWYVGAAAVLVVGALTAVLVLRGGSDLPSLEDSLVAESSFPDGFTVSDPTHATMPAQDSGIGISLDAGDSDFDPPECADLLNAEAAIDVEDIEVAQVVAEGDEPADITYTQAVMELPDAATEVASLDPLRAAIDSCENVELSGYVDGTVNLRDIGLPAAGDDSISLSYVVDSDKFDLALALAAVLYDDRILFVAGVTNQQDLSGVDIDELDAQMDETIQQLYADALEQAGV